MKSINFKITILILIILAISIPKTVYSAENNENETKKVKIGDINNDNKINSNDLLLLLRHVYAETNNKHLEWVLKEDKFVAADITKDKKVNSSDTIAMLRYIAAQGNPEIAKNHADWLKIDETDNDNNEKHITPTQKISVTEIKLNKTSIEMKAGEETKLIATVLPENATDKTVTWTSSNKKVVTVDNNGNIKAISKGEAVITAKTSNGKRAKCTVIVKEKKEDKKEVKANSIKLSKTSVTLKVNETLKLKATVLPENTTNKTVTWTSSNKKVVTVDKDGKIKAKSKGKAVIKAKTSNGKIAKCTVTVKEIEAESIKLNKTSITLKVNGTTKLKATITPKNTANKTITWKSSNKKVATVDNNGNVKAKSAGKATITAKTSNGKTAKCTVKVEEIKAKKIKLNKKEITLQVGKTSKLKATIEPKNVTNKTIKWSSSNKKVVTVDKNGNIKAKKEGEATITAKTSNGKTAKCKVTVEPKTTNGKIKLKSGNVIDTSIPVFIGHKYTNLTSSKKKQIAYLAFLEQGSLAGAKVELSLMANRTEKNKKQYGYNIYKYVMKSGWFGPANTGKIPSNPKYTNGFTSKYVDLVNEVLVKGHRYLPKNVDEHDCISDISKISTGNKNKRSNYTSKKTIIYNKYGAKYKFIGFAPNGGDPFGYTY